MGITHTHTHTQAFPHSRRAIKTSPRLVIDNNERELLCSSYHPFVLLNKVQKASTTGLHTWYQNFRDEVSVSFPFSFFFSRAARGERDCARSPRSSSLPLWKIDFKYAENTEGIHSGMYRYSTIWKKKKEKKKPATVSLITCGLHLP